MKAVFSNLLALTLVASHIAPVALAAPVASSSKEDKRSLKAIGTAVAGGIASGAAGAIVSNIFNKREEHDARSLTAIENFFGGLFNKRDAPSGLMVDTETGVIYMEVPDANEGRSLKAIGTAVAGGVASLAAGAVANHFLGNKRSESGVFVDSETGTIYMDVPDANEGRSLKAIGTAVAGGVASLAAGAVANHFLGDKRSESGAFVDTDTGIIYMDVADANEARSLKAIGTAVAGGVASGVAGAAISHFLGNKRDELSGLMVDTETGVIYMNTPDANEARSLKAIGTAVAGGVASGVAGAAISHFLGNKRDNLMVDTETGVIYLNTPDAPEARSLKAIGTAVAGGVASGVAGAAISHLLGRDASGIMVDTETGVLYMDVPDTNESRSLKAIGTAVAGGIASGAAGAIVSDLFNKRSDLYVDTETGTLFMDVAESNEERSLKAIGTAVAGGIASGAAGAVVSSLFNKREPEADALEARSLKAVGVAVAGGVASGAAGALASHLLGREASDLVYDTETGTIYMNVPDANEGRSLKAIGTAVAGGIASGAAGAIVSDLFNKRSDLYVDSETGTLFMDIPDAVESRSLKAIGTAVAGGLASGVAGAVVSDLFNKRAIDELD